MGDTMLALIESEVSLFAVRDYTRIIIGGFSQGGAMALATFLKFSKNESLGGVIAGSTWTPL